MEFLLLLAMHTYADFVMQERNIAKAKSYDNQALITHVLQYVGYMIVPVLFVFDFSITKAAMFIILNGLLHLITDYISSKMSSKAYKEGNLEKFWAVIGWDQFFHVAALYLTWGLLK